VNFGPPMYHPGPFGPQGQQMAWLPQNYGPSNPNMVASASMIPFAHQFPPLQNMAQYSPFNVMSPISPQGFEIQHIGGMSPPGSPPFQSFQDPITGWQGQIPPRAILGRHYHNRRYNGRGGRMNNRLPANFSNTEHHRSTSNSSSTTLASHGYDRPRFDGTVTVNGSFMGSTITSESYRSPPPVIGGSFTSSCETPSRNSFDGNTSESDKDSTPSPVVIRTLPDPKLGPETPTKSSSHPTVFVALSAPIIPETTDPADPANLYIKNLDPSIISTGEDLKKLFEPFGTVSSFVLATYPNTSISRGYGFVAFLKPEDAIAAKAKLDRSIVGSRRVFVTWAETKEVRTKRLKDLFNGNGGANEKDNTADKIEKARLEDGGLTHQSEKQNESEIIGESVDTSTKIPPSQPKEDVREHGAVGKNTEKTSEDDVPLMVAEQEIAVTNRWRGTQLTGSKLRHLEDFIYQQV
jgi:RNA recognition motif-containing protein